jgi:hypothetical protein
MSATEIIEQIKKLPSEEQQKLAAYFDEVKREASGKSASGVSAEFERIADKVFQDNAELFRKLAQ